MMDGGYLQARLKEYCKKKKMLISSYEEEIKKWLELLEKLTMS